MMLRTDVNLSILFSELPLFQRPAAARACGFNAVELWWPFESPVPSDQNVGQLLQALDEAGTRLVSLNFDAGDLGSGARGLVSLPGSEQRFRDNVEAAVGFAAQAGCRAFNALYGNRVDGVDPEAQDDLACENLAYAAAAAARIGGTILIETQNSADSPFYPLTRASDAAAVIAKVAAESGARNLAILADLYHLHRMGEDLVAVAQTYQRQIGHVQVADDPGRHQPGTGGIDFMAVFDALTQGGYDGYVGLEYKPLGPSADSFGWLASEERWTQEQER